MLRDSCVFSKKIIVEELMQLRDVIIKIKTRGDFAVAEAN